MNRKQTNKKNKLEILGERTGIVVLFVSKILVGHHFHGTDRGNVNETVRTKTNPVHIFFSHVFVNSLVSTLCNVDRSPSYITSQIFWHCEQMLSNGWGEKGQARVSIIIKQDRSFRARIERPSKKKINNKETE